MNKPNLTEEQKSKRQEALKEFHSNPNKPRPTAPREPKAISEVRKKIAHLTDEAAELISKTISGGLVKEVEIFKGLEEDKQRIINTDPSAYFDTIELDDGREVEVVVRYVQVPKTRWEIAKWVITQDIALKKAAEESKLRKIELDSRTKKAKDEGVIPPDQETIKGIASEGKHIRGLDIPDEWEEEEDD